MKLERLALWEERYLFTEQGETDKGFIGWLKGCFDEDRLVFSDMVMFGAADEMIRYELDSLCMFLVGESAGYMLRTFSSLNAFCMDKLHDHIPHLFNCECWGFRVMTEDYAWYIAFTPWNPKRHITIHCYDRKTLMGALAAEKGLPEQCYGVQPFTGERINIRYGADSFELFPQYGANLTENRKYADEQNEELNLTIEVVSAMENGVIYGWNSPAADPKNYDEKGHFHEPTGKIKKRRR